MKFIFPQNYKFNTKLLGIMDYQTAIINLIWGGIVFLIVNTIFNSLSLKICLFLEYDVKTLLLFKQRHKRIFFILVYLYIICYKIMNSTDDS